MLYIRQNATHKVLIGPVVAVGDGFTPVTTLSVATADEAEAILHDNSTVVSISGYTFAAITSADGYYHLTLQSGISGTVGHMTVLINDDSLCLPVKADFTVVEEAVYDAFFAASGTGVPAAGALEATSQSILTDTAEIGAAGVGLTVLATQASVNTIDDFLDTEVAAILADTNELQTDWVNGGRLDLILDARASQTSVDTIDGIVDSILLDTGTDGVVVAAASIAGIADAIWDEAQAGQVTAGTFGEVATETAAILVDTAEIGAAGAGLTALATQASVNTIDDFLDTEVAAILAAVDTEVGAIKTKTDSLTFTVAGQVDANTQYINDVQLAGDGAGTPMGPA